MSWDPSFIADLAAPKAPAVYAVRTVRIADEYTYRGDYTMATDPRFGDPILRGPPSCVGSTLSLDTFRATIGGFTFEICGNVNGLRTYIRRGTCVEILMGFGSYGSIDAFERIGIGRVDNVDFDGRSLRLSILDATSLIDGRWVEDGDKADLFYGLRSENRTSTTLTSDYTAGDTTLHVTSSSGFTRETSATGALIVGEHVLTYTSVGSGTFTGCSTVGRFLTDAADVATGEAVTEAAYLYGHPLGIARKVLTSTGDGTNGAYDVYPVGWGFGIPTDYIDMDEIHTEATDIVTVGSSVYKLELLVTEPVTDPRSWLVGWLSLAGCFLTMRQGQLTVRGLTGHPTIRRAPVMAFTDTEIVPWSLRSTWWDPTRPKEYGSTDVYYGTSSIPIESPVEPCGTLPAGNDKPVDLSSILFNEDGYADQGDVLTEIHNRVFMFAKLIGEAVTWTTGLAAMQLTVGDYVTLKTACTYLRTGYDRTDYESELLVVQVTPDFRAGTCTIVAVNQPDSSAGEP